MRDDETDRVCRVDQVLHSSLRLDPSSSPREKELNRGKVDYSCRKYSDVERTRVDLIVLDS